MTEKAMRGDRSAYDVANYPEKHASDINDGEALYHLPAPGTDGNIPMDDGTHWISVPNTGGGSPLTVEEEDADPTVDSVTKIKVSNGSLTDLGSGEVLITIPEDAVASAWSINIDGALSTATNVGAFVSPGDGTILAVYIYCKTLGTANNTIVDCHITRAGVYANQTIFTDQGNRPSLAWNDADGYAKSGTPDIVILAEGDILTFDIDAIATGAADISIILAVKWAAISTPPVDAVVGVKLSDIETYQRFIIGAHRGDINPTDGYPENTLIAMISAALKGVHRIELDVRKNSSGTWYLMHDATVDRTTNGTGNVVDKSDAQMDALTIDGGYGYDAGRHAGLYAPPTLEAVFTAIKPYDITIQIDNKDETDSDDLLSFVILQGWQQRVCINAYSQSEAQVMKAIFPDIVIVGDLAWDETDTSTKTIGTYTLAQVLAAAPRQIYMDDPVANYGATDQAELTRDAWETGARCFVSWDINEALKEWRRFTFLLDDQYMVDNYNPDAYPAAPNALDDEFEDGGAIDVKWTKVNDPAGADALNQTDHAGYLHVGLLELGTDNYDNAVRLYQTPPAYANAWEFVAKAAITVTGLAGEYGEYCGIHLYLGNSVNDEFVTVHTYINDSVQATSLVTYRLASGADNGTGGFTGMSTNQESGVAPGQFVYLKLKKTTTSAYTSANTYEAYVSTNGITWTQTGTISKTFTTACNEIGLMFRRPKSQGGTPYGQAIVDFFRRTV